VSPWVFLLVCLGRSYSLIELLLGPAASRWSGIGALADLL
jgi:hypothetical protein